MMVRIPIFVRKLVVLLVGLCLASPAQAQRVSMDAQIRAHGGLSVVGGPGVVGVSAGIDSRLGRLVFVDFGGFATLGGTNVEPAYNEEPREAFRLRHGVTLTPGLRIPHRQPENFRWDVLVRAGPSVIWTIYDGPRASGVPGDVWEIDTAIVAGPEFQVNKGAFGMRVIARYYLFRPYSRQVRDDVLTWLPQVTMEASYQFQGVVRNKWKEFTKGR